MHYYILLNGETIGPMTAKQVAAYPVNSETMVSADGGDWRPLYNFPELMEAINNPAQQERRQSNASDGMKIACGVLAILVGGIGLQYFLVGKVAGGIINILLTLVTCGLWSIVNLVQGIMILCMSDEDWREKWVYSDTTFPVF